MTGSTSTSIGRLGVVMRVMPHGSVMVLDPSTRRSYPFYKAGFETYHAMEEVRFITDETDTVIISLERVGNGGEGKSLRDVVYVENRRGAVA